MIDFVKKSIVGSLLNYPFVSPTMLGTTTKNTSLKATKRDSNYYNDKDKVVSITYEEIGLFPRSFSRVFDRFLKQVFSDVDSLVIQEYRFYRYLFLTTIKTIFILFFVPFGVNYIAKNYVVKPITEYFWNTQHPEIFLNSYEQKRAFAELEKFEEKIYFEALVGYNNYHQFGATDLPQPSNLNRVLSPSPFSPLNSNNYEGLISNKSGTTSVVSPQGVPSSVSQGGESSINKQKQVNSLLNQIAPPLVSEQFNMMGSLAASFQETGITQENTKVNDKVEHISLSPIPLEKAVGLLPISERVRDRDLDSFNFNLFPEGISKGQSKQEVSVFPISQRIPYNLSKDVFKIYQEKTIELATYYNNHSIEAITNFFADLLSLCTLLYLLVTLEIQINITKSFLAEVFFGLDDSKKSLLILLVTDLLVGYHSSNLWELFFQFIFNHYGIPESQTGIFLLVATLPVLLDVLFKYLIFRHLNRSSPATVATYQAIIE